MGEGGCAKKCIMSAHTYHFRRGFPSLCVPWDVWAALAAGMPAVGPCSERCCPKTTHPCPVLTQARDSTQPLYAVFLLPTCLNTPTWLLSSHKASWLLMRLGSRKVCPQADRYKCVCVLGPLVCGSVQECAMRPRKLIQPWTWKVLLYFPQVKGMQ